MYCLLLNFCLQSAFPSLRKRRAPLVPMTHIFYRLVTDASSPPARLTLARLPAGCTQPVRQKPQGSRMPTLPPTHPIKWSPSFLPQLSKYGHLKLNVFTWWHHTARIGYSKPTSPLCNWKLDRNFLKSWCKAAYVTVRVCRNFHWYPWNECEKSMPNTASVMGSLAENLGELAWAPINPNHLRSTPTEELPAANSMTGTF